MVRTTSKAKKSTVEVVGQIRSLVDDADLVKQRRAQITKAAITAFIHRGYHACTVRDIAKQAQVSVGMIYQYMGDKEDLLFLALVEILRACKEQISPALVGVEKPLQRFYKVVSTYCMVHAASPDATVLAYRETASLTKKRRNVIKQLEAEVIELISEQIHACINAGIFENDIDVDLFCYQLIMFSHTWALKAWYFRPRMTIDTYVERGLRMLLRGVMTTKGARQIRLVSDLGKI